MKTLILGGVKSGKSRYAENIAEASTLPITLIATALPYDAEMAKRIARHKNDRPDSWTVIEEPYALGSAIAKLGQPNHCVIVDCLTLWLTQLLIKEDDALLQQEINSLLATVTDAPGHLLIVSNENNMGVVPMGELSRRYCDEVGLLHQRIASICDNAVLVVAGLPVLLKGALPTNNSLSSTR